MGRLHVTPKHAGHAYDDGTRRTEILQTAALLIATSGLRTSLQEIADAPESCQAAFITISSQKKRSSSSCSAATTRTSTALLRER